MNVSQNQSQSKVLPYSIFNWKEAGGKVRRWGDMIFSVGTDTILIPCAMHASPPPMEICCSVILADRIIWASLLTGWSWIHQLETMEKKLSHLFLCLASLIPYFYVLPLCQSQPSRHCFLVGLAVAGVTQHCSFYCLFHPFYDNNAPSFCVWVSQCCWPCSHTLREILQYSSLIWGIRDKFILVTTPTAMERKCGLYAILLGTLKGGHCQNHHTN